jgi:RNA polymerase sigma-70 factor (ECF subfamily)
LKENDESLNSMPLSFDDLYRLYATDVLRVSYYYLGNRQQAEDVTQDVFVKLITNHPELEQGREKAWLFKVALNRCRDIWRGSWFKKVVLGHPSFELFPAPDEIGTIADRYALAEAVSRLRPEFKEVVLLFYYQGFSVSEISDMLGIAEGTVSSRLSRARNKLEEELKGDENR